MDEVRWKALMVDDKLSLTDAECQEGWHFCYEWDNLLIHPKMQEYMCCSCNTPYTLARKQKAARS